MNTYDYVDKNGNLLDLDENYATPTANPLGTLAFVASLAMLGLAIRKLRKLAAAQNRPNHPAPKKEQPQP